jgi:hypothetical protein
VFPAAAAAAESPKRKKKKYAKKTKKSRISSAVQGDTEADTDLQSSSSLDDESSEESLSSSAAASAESTRDVVLPQSSSIPFASAQDGHVHAVSSRNVPAMASGHQEQPPLGFLDLPSNAMPLQPPNPYSTAFFSSQHASTRISVIKSR